MLLTRLFAISALHDEIQEVDSTSGNVVNSFAPPADGAVSDGLAFDGENLWALIDADNNVLYKLDPDDGTVLDTFDLPNNGSRDGLATLNGLIYASESGLSQSILVYDPASRQVVTTIDIGAANEIETAPPFIGKGIAAIHGPNALLIHGTDLQTDEIFEVDATTGVIRNRWTHGMSTGAQGIAVVDGEIYLSQHAVEGIKVYDRSGTFLRTITPDSSGYQGLGGDDVGTPSTNDDSVTTLLQTPIVIDLLANDQSGEDVEVLEVSQPEHGSVTDHGDGTVTYDPGTWDGASDSFQYTVGKSQQEISAPDAQLSDWYGHAVASDGTLAVVGAPLDDDDGSTSGSIYILEKTGDNQWEQIAKVTPDDGSTGSQFGQSVAIDGDTVVVGAWINDANGNNSGAAYVFEQDQGGPDNWGQVAKLIGSDTTAGDKFGWSVAVDGDTVVVGAHEDDPLGSASGAAYVFQRDQGGPDNWGEAVKLVASDGTAIDRFGAAVSLDGTTVAIGAFRAESPAGNYSGAVYLFDEGQGGAGNWGEVTKVVPADLAANDQFGYSVALDGDRLAVGSHLDDFSGRPFRSNAGSVYLFQRDHGGADNWGQVDKLFASDPGAGDRLGSSVDLDGDWLVSGARYADVTYSNTGTAYVFQRDAGASTYSQHRKLGEPGHRKNDHYGISISIVDKTVMVGAVRGDSVIANNTGTTHFTDLRTSSATVNVALTTGPSSPIVEPVSGEDDGDDWTHVIDSVWEELGTSV